MMSTLARASLDGGIVVAMVWIVTRLFRLSPATRTVLWWCAAAKFVVALFWAQPILVPILPPAEIAAPPALVAVGPEQVATPTGSLDSDASPSSTSGPVARVRWSLLLVALWAAGCAVAAAIGLRRALQTLRIVRRSTPAPQPTQDMAAYLSARLGLRRTPGVLVSGEVNTPLVAGALRPVVLLPGDRFERLSRDQQLMILCHELAHVKRGDLWLGCAPALAERAFFFHPLAHVAAREYSLWREAACDAAVLDALDAAPREYGRLLLDLGVSRRRTGLVAAGAPWSFPNLKRRIVMLQDSSIRSKRSRVLSAAMVAIAAVAIVPIQLVARPSENPAPRSIASAGADDQEGSAERQVREARERLRALEREHQELALRAERMRTYEIERTIERQRHELRELEQSREHGRSTNEGKDDVRFVAFLDDDQTTMSAASERDVERARQHRRGSDRLIWFEQDGREYVIRDPATIVRVQEAWRDVYELGSEQGALGAEQGKLGAEQGALGALQGDLGAKQGALGTLQGKLGEEQALLAAREALHGSGADREALERERRALDQRMRALDAEMRALGQKMRTLDAPMQKLNAPMEELGRRMAVLGRRMEEVTRQARIETRRLFDHAIANGTAQIVK